MITPTLPLKHVPKPQTEESKSPPGSMLRETSTNRTAGTEPTNKTALRITEHQIKKYTGATQTPAETLEVMREEANILEEEHSEIEETPLDFFWQPIVVTDTQQVVCLGTEEYRKLADNQHTLYSDEPIVRKQKLDTHRSGKDT